MKKLFSYMALFCGLFIVTGCEKDDEPKQEPPVYDYEDRVPIVLSRSEQDVVYKQNEFSLEVFKKLVGQSGVDNFMTSPLSLSMAMSMFANGAMADTRTEIISTLGFENADIDAVNALNYRLTQELLEADKLSKLSLANSMWFDAPLQVNDEFVSRNEAAYGAEIFTADFGDEDNVKSQINSWVDNKTNGLIPNFMSKGAGLPKHVFIANALYFNSIWAAPFEKSLSTTEEFYNADGSVSTPMTMHASDYSFLGKRDTDGASWITLRFGNMAYEFVLILPDEGKSVEEYIQGLSAEDFKALNSRELGADCVANVQLPKFEISSKLDLDIYLRQMGMKKAFEEQTADFSGISSQPFALSTILQKAVLKVDETGVTATSATGQKWDIDFLPMTTEDLIVNRPFAFMIRETSTRTILFLGRVNNL